MNFNHIKEVAETNLNNYGGRKFTNGLEVIFDSCDIIKDTIFNDIGEEYSEEEAILMIMILLYRVKKTNFDVKRLFATYIALKWELMKEIDNNAD